MSDTIYMLTTVDNPYNPFTSFDEWDAWDRHAGYNTTAFLARITRTSDELSEPQQHTAINLAIDEIVKENVNGMYRKVSATDFETTNEDGE